MNTPKRWWAPVWTGLVMDPAGTHCHRMKNAVWLWLYCILNANRGTGLLIRKLDTIALDTGMPRRTVTRWIATLRDNGYIDTRTTGRYLVIRVRQWKSLNAPNEASLVRQGWHTRDAKHGTSQQPIESRSTPPLSDKSALGVFSNDKELTRERLKIDIDKISILENGNTLSPREALLADDLATALDDRQALAFYRSVAKRLPERVLRRLLGEAREIPTQKITTSRGTVGEIRTVRDFLER